MASIKPEELEKLVAGGGRMYRGGLARGATGAIGARLSDGTVAVTAARARLGFLAETDLVVVNGAGIPGGEGAGPGRDTGVIRAVLAAQPEAGSAIKVNSVYATALSHKGRGMLESSAELLEDLGGVAFVPFYRPGTAGLAGAVAEVLRSNRVALVEGQGAVVWGEDIESAIDLAEELEAAARVAFILDYGGGE